MNGPSETATLTTTPIQSNGVLFSPYYRHFPTNGHYHFYPNNNNNNNHSNNNHNSFPGKPLIPANGTDDIHVTVLQIDQNKSQHHQHNHHQAHQQTSPLNAHPPYHNHHDDEKVMNCVNNQNGDNTDFVTVLKIVSTGATLLTQSTTSTTATNMTGSHNQLVFMDNKRGEIEEEVTIYRLPGERLGMALRFDGGQSANETIRRVFVQSITLNSPSAKAIGLMLGMLREGDEILNIDGRASSSLTRLECITLLRDAPVCIRLFVRRSITSNAKNGQLGQNGQLNQYLHHSDQPVPNYCQMTMHLPNNELQNHCLAPTTSSLSSSLSSLASTITNNPNSNKNQLNQLINNSLESIPKKVPPPVPPRMATTTLSSKRKPRPMPMPPDAYNQQAYQQQQFILEPIIIENNSTESLSTPPPSVTAAIQQNGIEQSMVQVEKPPRRKNLHNSNGNPPPLPPRRPKGPPPKPPTERLLTSNTSVINISTQNINNNNDNKIINGNCRLSPSVVTVVTSRPSPIDIPEANNTFTTTSSGNNQFGKINLICSTAAPTTTITTITTNNTTNTTNVNHNGLLAHNSSKTTKVTFNISNSKVSSFIRQTAEKLHRKLSGKNTLNESDDDSSTTMNKISINDSSIKMNGDIHPDNNDGRNNEKTDDLKTHSTNINQLSMPATPASYADVCQDNEESFESDTDDTSSSVSTIIERGSFSNLVTTQLEQNLNPNIFGKHSDDTSIVDRVLSPFEKLDNEFDMERSALCLSPSLLPIVSTMNEQMETDLLTTKTKPSAQLSSNKTLKLISNDEQLPVVDKELFPVESPNSIRNDTEIRRDQPHLNCRSEVDGDKEKNATPASDLNSLNFDDDDEDLDAIKNDIFSRLDDDKDFMIDTDYLNKSSSCYLYHHTGSELILNSYSELSSITEEDEEDDVSELKNFESTAESKGIVAEKPIVDKNHEELKQANEQMANNQPPIDEQKCEEEKINGNHIENDIDKEIIPENVADSPTNQSPKISLNNVFEFLNKAADDFEFVERMLELTNDKIDSIDDIMRIRESLRGLQESEQRQNLQRFLDGKDVFEELIALSSPTSSSSLSMFSSSSSSSSASSSSSSHSPVSSPENEYSVNMVKTKENNNVTYDKRNSVDEISLRCQTPDGFVSLPVNGYSDKSSILQSTNYRQEQPQLIPSQMSSTASVSTANTTSPSDNKSMKMYQSSIQFESKIPTLTPKLPLSSTTASLNRRSHSISNIFTRSNGFNSLIETRPSLIPRPISNFNLTLPSPLNLNSSNCNNAKPITQRANNRSSHNCLNRSTSMQSIFSTNSLSRAQVKTNNSNSKVIPRRQSSVTSTPTSLSTTTFNGFSNYHHNCLKNQDNVTGSTMSYGSLSRPVSKSNSNVYNTGSLPRPPKSTSYLSHSNRNLSMNSNNGNNHNQQFDTLQYEIYNDNHNGTNHDFRTTSLTDLTNGFGFQTNSTTASKTSTFNNFNGNNNNSHYQQRSLNFYNNHQQSGQLQNKHSLLPSTSHQNPSSSIKHYSFSSGNLFRSDSLNLAINSNNNNPDITNTNSNDQNIFTLTRNGIDNNLNNSFDSLDSFTFNQCTTTASNGGLSQQKKSSFKQHLHPPQAVRSSSTSTLSLLPTTTILSLPTITSHHHHNHQQSQQSQTSFGITAAHSTNNINQNNNPGANFWHCNKHSTTKRTSTAVTFAGHSSLPSKVRGNQSSGSLNQLNTIAASNESGGYSSTTNKTLNKTLPRKNESKSNAYSLSTLSLSSLSSSSSKSDNEELNQLTNKIVNQSPQQPQSILRNSSNSKTNLKRNSVVILPKKQQQLSNNNNNNNNKHYWNQDKHFELSSSPSDSEGSDTTFSSSGDSDYQRNTSTSNSNIWPEKSNNRVCFMDQIVEQKHRGLNANVDEQSTIDGELPNVVNHHLLPQQQQQKLAKMDENLYSSSPEVSVLSSSISTSSISSLGSSTGGDLPQSSKIKTVKFNENGLHSNEKQRFYLSNHPHREDSGIFASDDTSTSEFSQSPSPELINDRNSIEKVQIMPQKSTQQIESTPNKEISFLDTTTRQRDSNSPPALPSKQIQLNNGTNPISMSLSRSASAPCETGCEISFQQKSIPIEKNLPLTPPESPPDTLKNEMNDYKQSNLFMLRDSFMTVRRQQNISKLKGLIIPEIINDDKDDESECTESNVTTKKIELPTIISEDILKIQNRETTDSNGQKTLNERPNEYIEPIEMIPLKPANGTVPKYSPMFKRRTFSMPNTDVYANNLSPKQMLNGEHGEKPIEVPPKPKLGKNYRAKMSVPPPLPPKRMELNLNIIENSTKTVPNEPTTSNESFNEINKTELNRKLMNDFVIAPKQHKMLAIIYHLSDLNLCSEKDYLQHLGITIKGGFGTDNDNDSVTVENLDPNGLAVKDGRLQKGDRIISINGKRLAGMTFNKIMELLLDSCLSLKVVLVCSRPSEKNEFEEQSASNNISSTLDNKNETSSITDTNNNNNNAKIMQVNIVKDVTGLGFIIEGGKNSSFGDRPIIIKRIFRGGPVDKEGTLLEGDELVFVNDHSLEHMTRAEAWSFLKQIPGGKVSLVVRRKKYL